MKTIDNTRYYTVKELKETQNFDSQIFYKLRVMDEEMELIGEQRFMPKSLSFNNVAHYCEAQIPELKKILNEMTAEKRAEYKNRVKEKYAEIRKENKALENE